MSATIRVEFDRPEHGWICLSLSADDQVCRIVGSSAPDDSVRALASAVVLLARGQDDVTVPWNEEPVRCELRFLNEGDQTSIVVTRYRDNRQLKRSGRCQFEAHGKRHEICLAFWRAFRRLESQMTPEEYERAWHHRFPADSVQRLTQHVERGQQD